MKQVSDAVGLRQCSHCGISFQPAGPERSRQRWCRPGCGWGSAPEGPVPETEIAWAAGFFDGEGSVSLARVGFNTYRSLLVSVSNMDERGLVRLQRWFGGRLYFENSRRCHRWIIRSRHAQPFLRAIRPYVSQKGEAIDIALSYQSTVGKQGRRHVPDAEKEYRERLVGELWAENART